jgi:glycine/D-amino acid oxidase-like deaminating enzyme
VYDIVIVGAGISGLYSARQLARQYPNLKIALAEKYKGLGGRTYSYSPPHHEDITWEMGAGRIRRDHRLVMGLLKEYGLTWVPIGEAISFKKSGSSPIEANTFESVGIPVYLQPLSFLNTSALENYTIQELLEEIYGSLKTREILAEFPYRAEVSVMRADLALDGFLGHGEMASHEGYGIIAEGFSELVRRMREELEKRGVAILQKHELVDFTDAGHGATDLTFKFGYDEPGKPHGEIVLRARRAVILALHKDAVAKLPPFRGWKTLEHLKTEPLLRTYAIFPKRGGKVWFDGMTRIVTPQRPRYILPMNADKGVIMISYTDADDTRDYMRIQKHHGDKALEKAILKDVRALFPGLYIPNPTFFRSHPWETGTTYWLPGNYNPLVASEGACHPLGGNIWMCGESWSMRQAWVEGALEHTEQMLGKLKKELGA